MGLHCHRETHGWNQKKVLCASLPQHLDDVIFPPLKGRPSPNVTLAISFQNGGQSIASRKALMKRRYSVCVMSGLSYARCLG